MDEKMGMGCVTPMVVMPLASHERMIKEATERGMYEGRLAAEAEAKAMDPYVRGHFAGQQDMKGRIQKALEQARTTMTVGQIVREQLLLHPHQKAKETGITRFAIYQFSPGSDDWSLWDEKEGHWVGNASFPKAEAQKRADALNQSIAAIRARRAAQKQPEVEPRFRLVCDASRTDYECWGIWDSHSDQWVDERRWPEMFKDIADGYVAQQNQNEQQRREAGDGAEAAAQGTGAAEG
jgi:hypothetical protein